MRLFGLVFLCTLILQDPARLAAGEAAPEIVSPESLGIGYGVIDKDLVPFAYSGGERFRYDISYTGGLKLGELYLKLDVCRDKPDCYIIHARVTTEDGLFETIYPIEDIHVTQVSGPERLPFHYEVWQKEGYNYEAHRVVIYEQDKEEVHYTLNEGPVEIYEVGRAIQNEFSSFFASRVMDLTPGQPFVVPTFADDKRNEVVVMVREPVKLKKTVLGDIRVVVVEPIMKFSGLYDKRGDTVVWYTDDSCRVPVQVNSKLMIGSLTARLVAYENPACPQYNGAILEKYREEI